MLTSAERGSLSVHLVDFCRFLRSKDFLIGPGEELELFEVINKLPFQDYNVFRLTLSQLLCKSRSQQLSFQDLFDQFWQELFASFNAKVGQLPQSKPKKKPERGTSLESLKNWLYQNQDSETKEIATEGRGVNRSGQKLNHYQSQQVKNLIRIITQLAKSWASRPGRRKIRAKKAGQIDLRQVLRKNLSTGELINISFRENKMIKPRLVVVCDVSKSMEMFSDFTIQLLYAFQNNYRSIETFVFGTELYRITKLLKHQTFSDLLVQLSSSVPDWSGGTRIGHCLDNLIKGYGARLFHGKVIFLIISDGWDTGEIELLEQSMSHIKRRVSKTIWLNPQASKPGFTPQVKGMIAALPYIDVFQGVHDLETFEMWQKSYKSR